MQGSKLPLNVDHPTPNLYLTAIAELDDDRLFEMVAGAGVILAQYSNGTDKTRKTASWRKPLLDATQMARTLYSEYHKRMGDPNLSSRQCAERGNP